MKKFILVLGLTFSIPSFAKVYLVAKDSQNAMRLNGSIIGGFARAHGTYGEPTGNIQIPNPIMIDLLDPKTKKKVSQVLFDEEDLDDGRLVAQRVGRKFSFCAIGIGGVIYQSVAGCYGVDLLPTSLPTANQ